MEQHYCIICKVLDNCTDEFDQACDYRRLLLAHGLCYYKLLCVEKEQHDKIAAVLREDASGF